MASSFAKWWGVVRRPLPRRVVILVLAAALGVLGAVFVLRQFPAGRAALWRVYAFVMRKSYSGGPVKMDDAVKRLRERMGNEAVLPLPGARIVIHKRSRRLELYSGERLIKSCAVTMGRHADQGHKDAKGDGCTPEGRYFICTRNGQSRFHLFLGLNYPNAADAARGLEQKMVSEDQHAAIAAAETARQRPPWDTRLGGEVGVHGGGTQPPDWTLGCIAVENGDIEELWAATEYWTPVEIRAD